jgi:hypothetical protein
MQSTHLKKSTTQKNDINDMHMSKDTYARWLCLLEGIDIIDKKMQQYGHRLKNENLDWIKPLAFQKYINERFEAMKCDIEELEKTDETFDLHITTPKSCITSQAHSLR